MGFPNQRTFSFDANTVLSDNAAAYTATGYSQAAAVDGIVDLGGNQGVTITLPAIDDLATYTPQQARIDAYLIADVTAIKISSGNETYKLMALVSNDPSFAAGNVEHAGEIMVGKGTSRDGINMKDSVIGRYEIPFTNNIAGSLYQFLKLYLVIAGTTPSISISSFVAVTPEP